MFKVLNDTLNPDQASSGFSRINSIPAIQAKVGRRHVNFSLGDHNHVVHI